MFFEQPKTEQKSSESSLRFRNALQMDLAKKHCVNCSNEDLLNWIFNELSPAVHRFIEQNPEILNDYKRDPRATFEHVDKELHLEDIVPK